jgi:hypothetical protein
MIALDALKTRLQSASTLSEMPHDPLRYYYLQALLTKLADRATYPDAQFQQILLKLNDLVASYLRACQQAVADVAHAAHEPVGLSALKGLNRTLQQRHQQTAVREHNMNTQQDPRRVDLHATETRKELRAVRHYQQLFEKMSVERLLNKVMQEIPENAGPLNPERLVIRCLSAMQTISPVYAQHLIGYYEALISLQSLSASDK